jgi:hypothetical protein
MSELDDLRKEVSKARERVTRKIARLRREKNIAVSNTRHDPRIDRKELNTFSKSELAQVLYQYNTFTNRNVQFERGKYNVALQKNVVDEARRQFKASSERAKEWEENIGSIRNPTGDSIANAQSGVARRENANQSYSPFPDYKFDPRRFDSEEKLVNYVNTKLKETSSPTYLDDEATKVRRWIGDIHSVMGVSNEEIDNLTDFQLLLMWNTTNYLTDKGIVYETYKALNSESVDSLPYSDRTVKDSERELDRIPVWASKQPKTYAEHLEQKRIQDAKDAKKRK